MRRFFRRRVVELRRQHGSTSVHIAGRITTDQGGPVQMSLTYVAGSVTVAEVNDQQFGAHAEKAFRAQMVMQTA
jgi:hypothetical protein